MENMIINLQDVDISTTPGFKEYSDQKEYFKFELENRPFPHTYIPSEIKARNDAISNGLSKMHPSSLKNKADELIKLQELSKHNEIIDLIASKRVGNYNQFNNLWSPMLWQSRSDSSTAKVKIGEQTVEVFDLDFLIAESLQHLYSSEDPKAEYYDWIERQRQIEVAINTGGTTEDEIAQRNTFISFLDDRETEIKRIILLYSGAAFNPNCRQQTEAQEKLKFLTFKLSELRRLRERTQATKSQADDKEYFAQKEKQERQAAINATMAISGVALASEMMSLGERRLLKENGTLNFEHGIGESFVNFRPETTNKEQALSKINTAELNRKQMADMFMAMRNGLSKDEWLKQKAQTSSNTSPINTPKSRLRGFNVHDFMEYSNNRSV